MGLTAARHTVPFSNSIPHQEAPVRLKNRTGASWFMALFAESAQRLAFFQLRQLFHSSLMASPFQRCFQPH